jgi:hypothetical protein
MIQRRTCLLFIFLAFLFSAGRGLQAQTTSLTTNYGGTASMSMPSWQPDEFPQIFKDARRFDQVVFGIYPFAWLFTSAAYGITQASHNHWNTGYLPIVGNPTQTQRDWRITLFSAIGVSVAAAVADQIIYQVQKAHQARVEKQYISLTPIIVKKKLDDDSSENKTQ